MRTDLTFEIPPGLIASSISSTGASRTASHASKRSRRRRKATSRLRSLVDCESTVSTSSPSGSPCGSITGIPYIARRRSRTARTRLARGRRQGVGTRRSIVPAPMAPVTEHHDTLSDQPLFWRSAEGGEPPVLYLHGVPTSSDDWLAFLERTGGLAPDLPGFGRSGKRGDGDFTMPGYDRFVEAFLDHAEVERVRLVVHDWGVVGLLWAQRFPERVERLVVINAVPLLPGYRWHRVARLWRMRGVGEVAIGLVHALGLAAAAPAAAWPTSPGRTSTRAPSARSCSSTARARRTRSRAPASTWAHRLPGARRVGRSRPLPPAALRRRLRRARSAARPRCCTSTTPGTGPGSTGRMPSIASPRSWTPRADPGVGAGRRASRRVYLVLAPAERGPRGAGLPRRPRPRAVGQRLVRRPSHARLQRALPAAGARCSARGSSGR